MDVLSHSAIIIDTYLRQTFTPAMLSPRVYTTHPTTPELRNASQYSVTNNAYRKQELLKAT